MGLLGSIVQLIGRYPELAQNSDFFKWTRAHAARKWHEQIAQDTVTVIVQSTDGLSLFAAEVDRRKCPQKPVKVRRVAESNLLETEVLRDLALLQFKRVTKITDPRRLLAIRPIVEFREDNSIDLQWEIETWPEGDVKARYRYSSDGTLSKASERIPSTKGKPFPPRDQSFAPASADDLASNELHHLADLESDALTAIGSATTIEDKARGIFEYVSVNYGYDDSILHIVEFTWADILTRNLNTHSGICDEWAVVQISMLRAVGIPARLKFLVWQQGGEPGAHACVEYRDGTSWFHMDALFNAFHEPQVYRNAGFENVTVMDADYPVDHRSTVPAWGVPDPTGDKKLHPYADFLISPSYPGDARPGYSY